MKAKTVIVIAAILAVAGWMFNQQARRAAPVVSDESADSTATQLVAKVRVPPRRLAIPTPPPEVPAPAPLPTNRMAQLLEGDGPPRLSLAQLDSYLAGNRRSAESLLAAFRATQDPALLREAAEKYPNDPHVAFAAYFAALNKPDTFPDPEARRHWLEAFQKSAPDNALPGYLSALENFKSGRTDLAVQDLLTAAGKTKWEDYSVDFIQSAEEAYRAAGYSDTESKTWATGSLPLPHLVLMKQLGTRVAELAGSYTQAGDADSAQKALQVGLNLAQRFDESSGQFMIQNLVSMAIERRILEAMDPGVLLAGSGQTVSARLDEIAKRRDTYKALGQESGRLLQTLSEQDLATYFDRMKTFGELDAMRWALNKR